MSELISSITSLLDDSPVGFESAMNVVAAASDDVERPSVFAHELTYALEGAHEKDRVIVTPRQMDGIYTKIRGRLSVGPSQRIAFDAVGPDELGEGLPGVAEYAINLEPYHNRDGSRIAAVYREGRSGTPDTITFYAKTSDGLAALKQLADSGARFAQYAFAAA